MLPHPAQRRVPVLVDMKVFRLRALCSLTHSGILSREESREVLLHQLHRGVFLIP